MARFTALQDLTVFGPLHCEVNDIYVSRTFTVNDLADLLPRSRVEYVALLCRSEPD